jgi:hypothetical protein
MDSIKYQNTIPVPLCTAHDGGEEIVALFLQSGIRSRKSEARSQKNPKFENPKRD